MLEYQIALVIQDIAYSNDTKHLQWPAQMLINRRDLDRNDLHSFHGPGVVLIIRSRVNVTHGRDRCCITCVIDSNIVTWGIQYEIGGFTDRQYYKMKQCAKEQIYTHYNIKLVASGFIDISQYQIGEGK
jgi:hypothetical protein